MSKIVIRAGDEDFLEALDGLTRISPGTGGGLAKILFHRRVVRPGDRTGPLFESGGEEIYEIEPGFCLQLSDGVVAGDWRLTIVGGPENSLRLRIIFEGETHYIRPITHMAGKGGRCSYAIQPSGGMLTVGVLGKSVLRSCVLGLSDGFLLDALGVGVDQLPDVVAGAWHRSEIVMGDFPLSRRTLLAARRCFGTRASGCWSDLKVRAQAYELLHLVFADWLKTQHGKTDRVRINPDDREKLVALRDRICIDPFTATAARALCREYGLNRNKLHYGFRYLFGVSLHDHVVEQRMEGAMRLLQTTDLPISEIAWRIGFSEPTNFTAAFKRHFSMLPSEVRAGAQETARLAQTRARPRR